MPSDASFSERIRNKYKRFGRYEWNPPSFIFVNETRNMPITVKLKWIRQEIFHHFREEVNRIVRKNMPTLNTQKELSAFWHISTIFENRDRQPDAARKAERKLIRILANDFFERNPRVQRMAAGMQQEQVYRKQVFQEEELTETKKRMESIERRISIQEKILRELKETTISGQGITKTQIEGITKQVVKKMEQDMHLEKLRRGL